MSITRRIFLRNGSLAVIGTAAIPAFLTRAAAAAESLGAKNKRLVVIFQRGAADGLNIVVPHAERAYYSMRPSINIPRNAVSNSTDSSDFIPRSHLFNRCGSSVTWPSFTPLARPIPRARTSTRRISWNPARRESKPQKMAG